MNAATKSNKTGNPQGQPTHPKTTTSASTMSTTETKDQAETLRLQGNDAFQMKDYQQAYKLYTASVELEPKANTLSNLAAVLHKLGHYDEARQAAKQATEVDPAWAKGWWRFGLACELTKDFVMAHTYYREAVKLDPKQKGFQSHLSKVKERLQLIENANSDDMPVIELTLEGEETDIMDSTHLKAFFQIQNQLPGVPRLDLVGAYVNLVHQQSLPYPTSCQYSFCGIIQWIAGIQASVVDLAMGTDRQAMELGQVLRHQLQSNNPLTERQAQQAQQLLGGLPTGNGLDHLLSGFSHLAGNGTFVEMAPGRICPQPTSLRQEIGFQILAQMWVIQKWIPLLEQHQFDFGSGMKCSPATLEAYITFWANFQRARAPIDVNHKSKDCSPQEIFQYVQAQVQAGRDWRQGGLSCYCSFIYRGTVVYATVVRSMGQQHARAYQMLKWAREFITLVDEEYHITQNGSYEQYGNVFRPSLRIGVVMAELALLTFLRGDAINDGPYTIDMSIPLCQKISAMAQTIDGFPSDPYKKAQLEVAWVRKPLAMAHSILASHLCILHRRLDKQEFLAVVKQHGLLPGDALDFDPYAMIAEHYHIAAQNELPDADEGAILWWGYAANLAQSSTAQQRTLGDLRSAIATAQANDKSRDVNLFGENRQANGEFESMAKLTADHFQDQPDTFVFPKLLFILPERILELEDGTMLCNDFEKYQRNELKALDEDRRNERRNKVMDTTALDKEFGKVNREEVPTLANFCIRSLHKEGASFAAGETDGDTIIQKAMAEGAEGGEE